MKTDKKIKASAYTRDSIHIPEKAVHIETYLLQRLYSKCNCRETSLILSQTCIITDACKGRLSSSSNISTLGSCTEIYALVTEIHINV